MDTLLQFSGFDDEGIVCFKIDSKIVYNVFEIALQAMIGSEVDIPYRSGRLGLTPRYYDINMLPDPRLDKLGKAALKYLISNAVKGPKNSLIWFYNFDIEFRGTKVKAPWVSAFGQAYCVLAFLIWYKYTSTPEYLDFAIKGARLFGINQHDGGVANALPESGLFFEELPPPASTRILNAHLISVVALLEVVAQTSDPFLAKILKEGLVALESVIDNYDTGSWSCYDQAIIRQLFLRLSPNNDTSTLYVGNIRLLSGEKELGKIDAYGDNSFIGGNWQLSGIDWGTVCEIEQPHFKGRKIIYGPAIHLKPAPTGTRQNSYVLIKTAIPSDLISLSIDIYAEGELYVDIEYRDISDSGLSFIVPDKHHHVKIEKGLNKISVPLQQKYFCEPLPLEYHCFHRYLLELIGERISNQKIVDMANKFRKYERLRIDKPYPDNGSLGDKPCTLFVSVNTECGLRCKMCDVGTGNKKASLYKNLKTERNCSLDAGILLRRIQESGINKVHFIGTEPLLYKQIFEVLKKLNSIKVQTILTTNGINLPQTAEKLAKNPPNMLWISLDGPPPIHDYIRGLNGLFQRIADGLTILIKTSKKIDRNIPKLYLSCAISNINQNELVNLMEAVDNWPIEAVTFTHLNYVTTDVALRHNIEHPDWPISPSTVNDQVAPCKVDPWRLYCEIEAVKYRWPGRAFFVPDTDFSGVVDLYHKPEQQVGRTSCFIPWQCMEIGADGNVVSMSRCFYRILGNIQKDSLDKIWHGKDYELLRSFLRSNGVQPPCLRCCGIL
jgi:Fe-coproporphyrin III synthase